MAVKVNKTDQFPLEGKLYQHEMLRNKWNECYSQIRDTFKTGNEVLVKFINVSDELNSSSEMSNVTIVELQKCQDLVYRARDFVYSNSPAHLLKFIELLNSPEIMKTLHSPSISRMDCVYNALKNLNF